MKRAIYALVSGLVMWALVATLLNRGLRLALPGYAAAEPTLIFTLTMKVARLILAALASLAAGAIAGLIAPARKGVPWLLGAIIMAPFIPTHVQLWAKFPVWYHLTFLGTLVPLVVLGGKLRGQGTGNRLQGTQNRFAAN